MLGRKALLNHKVYLGGLVRSESSMKKNNFVDSGLPVRSRKSSSQTKVEEIETETGRKPGAYGLLSVVAAFTQQVLLNTLPVPGTVLGIQGWTV
jgi:hypothetical protein